MAAIYTCVVVVSWSNAYSFAIKNASIPSKRVNPNKTI